MERSTTQRRGRSTKPRFASGGLMTSSLMYGRLRHWLPVRRYSPDRHRRYRPCRR
ncbi:hypothetical protein NMD1_02318 [Novosphingobium sp. MD-1]|nr:hypothetical protein NMD1_02318 [Novosphingobium sp. MD-1]